MQQRALFKCVYHPKSLEQVPFPLTQGEAPYIGVDEVKNREGVPPSGGVSFPSRLGSLGSPGEKRIWWYILSVIQHFFLHDSINISQI